MNEPHNARLKWGPILEFGYIKFDSLRESKGCREKLYSARPTFELHARFLVSESRKGKAITPDSSLVLAERTCSSRARRSSCNALSASSWVVTAKASEQSLLMRSSACCDMDGRVANNVLLSTYRKNP